MQILIWIGDLGKHLLDGWELVPDAPPVVEAGLTFVRVWRAGERANA